MKIETVLKGENTKQQTTIHKHQVGKGYLSMVLTVDSLL